MKVTIVGRENGVGLEKDKRILTDLLEDKGVVVDFRSIDHFIPVDNDADVCIFTEIVDNRFLGKTNILIPNQEWFYRRWLPDISRFDAIFCKTIYAGRIFEEYHPNVIYTGFTSLDLFKEEEKKMECFHSQGKSRAKGTSFIIEAWKDRNLPVMHIITKEDTLPSENLIAYKEMLPQEEYISLMNRSLIHIYPSQSEGYGHCLNEARSCAAVVVSTDFPPMNELVSAHMVATKEVFDFEETLGSYVTISPASLCKIVREIYQMENLLEIGKMNRMGFLANDLEFRQRFIHELFKM